jgi:hypothetical protein
MNRVGIPFAVSSTTLADGLLSASIRSGITDPLFGFESFEQIIDTSLDEISLLFDCFSVALTDVREIPCLDRSLPLVVIWSKLINRTIHGYEMVDGHDDAWGESLWFATAHIDADFSHRFDHCVVDLLDRVVSTSDDLEIVPVAVPFSFSERCGHLAWTSVRGTTECNSHTLCVPTEAW